MTDFPPRPLGEGGLRGVRVPPLFFLLSLLLALACIAPNNDSPISTPPTQGTHHATLIVLGAEGAARSVDVGFNAETVEGWELLERSGLGFTAQYFPSPGGWALCSVAGEGCSYPDDRCLCRSSYWSQWRWDPESGDTGEWVTLAEGLLGQTVRDGSAWGVVWGDGSKPPSVRPR